MNDGLTLDLKSKIKQVKLEIIKKEQLLDELIEKYQQLSEITLLDDLGVVEND